MTPTARSLAHLRNEGWVCEVVEHRPKHTGRTRDLFGVADILALRPGQTLAVQTTTAANVAARVTKVQASPWLPVMLAAGWTFRCHGWREDGTLRDIEVAA